MNNVMIGGIGATKVFSKAIGQKIVSNYYDMVSLGFSKKMILDSIYKKYGYGSEKENYIEKLINNNKEIYEKNKNKTFIPESIWKA